MGAALNGDDPFSDRELGSVPISVHDLVLQGPALMRLFVEAVAGVTHRPAFNRSPIAQPVWLKQPVNHLSTLSVNNGG